MSAFLGPIHFWLYEKIKNQESLTNFIGEKAKEKAWIQGEKIYHKELPALETVVDEGNIHGWLQEEIRQVEKLYADLINKVLEEDGTRLDKLKSYAWEFGKDHPVNEGSRPREAYKFFEDFFLNGMPCDHVNQVTVEVENRLEWKMNSDIHGSYWPNGDASLYYDLRKSVMDGMLHGSQMEVVMEDAFHYRLEAR